MIILSLDTTTSAGSVALMRHDRVVREQASDASRPQAARLPGELMALLEAEHLSLRDIDGFTVGIGPGSFTGLRVGIATMQGLAVAMDRPLFGVSALDALATRAGGGPAERVTTWVDAWRGEVYAALYERGREVQPPIVAPPHTLLRAVVGTLTFTGDGALLHRDVISTALGHRARFTEPISPLLAGVMATLAADAYTAGQRPPPHAIRALYVRRPDAELARDAGRTGA